MATMKSRLSEALASSFKGADVKLRTRARGGRITGSLVWDGFEGMPQIDRQVKLRRVIDTALQREEQQAVSFILTLTPEEDDALRAERQEV